MHQLSHTTNPTKRARGIFYSVKKRKKKKNREVLNVSSKVTKNTFSVKENKKKEQREKYVKSLNTKTERAKHIIKQEKVA